MKLRRSYNHKKLNIGTNLNISGAKKSISSSKNNTSLYLSGYELCIYTYRKHMSDSLHSRDLGVVVRNTQPEDITKIVDLQKESFPYLVRYGNIWHPEELESHLRIFPQGQFVVVEPDGMVVGSASTLIVLLKPEYAEHTWKEITAGGMFTNHNSNGDSLYGADISTHPKHRHEGIGRIFIRRERN